MLTPDRRAQIEDRITEIVTEIMTDIPQRFFEPRHLTSARFPALAAAIMDEAATHGVPRKLATPKIIGTWREGERDPSIANSLTTSTYEIEVSHPLLGSVTVPVILDGAA